MIVSVVASAYNAASFLEWSLGSILSQTLDDFELILVDDGSTDNTYAIASSLAEKDSRLRIIRQENQGLTKALIAGCNLARGTYIARHDVDDFSLPNRLREQVVFLENHREHTFVSCWADVYGPRNEPLYSVSDSVKIGDNINQDGFVVAGHGSVMFRRSSYTKVGGYRWQFYFAQDYDLWLRLVREGKFHMIPEVLYSYRFDGTGISGKYREAQQRLSQIARALTTAASEADERLLLEEASTLRPGGIRPATVDLTAGDYFIARCLLKNRDPRARVYLKSVLRSNPMHVRAIGSYLHSLFSLSRFV